MGTNRDHVVGLLSSRLESIEQRFGGCHRNVPRRKVSSFDPRGPREIERGGMRGGDRMLVNGYASHYAQYLLPMVERQGRGMVIVELGILRGAGLAMLCEIFPRAARIIGLDVDCSHFRENMPALEELGAFRKRKPEVYDFDELAPHAAQQLQVILAGDQVDVFIHDALHYSGVITNTLAYAQQHFAQQFRCFVEDNDGVASYLAHAYGSRFAVAPHGRLTVLWRDWA